MIYQDTSSCCKVLSSAQLYNGWCDFMQQTTGIIMPLDWQGEQFQRISDLHLDEWRRFCYPLSRWQLQQLGVLI